MNLIKALILLCMIGLALTMAVMAAVGWAATWLFYRPKEVPLRRRRRAF